MASGLICPPPRVDWTWSIHPPERGVELHAVASGAGPPGPGLVDLDTGNPAQLGRRWVVEATNSRKNDFAKPRLCTERTEVEVQADSDLARVVMLRSLQRRTWKQYRWEGKPRAARIR